MVLWVMASILLNIGLYLPTFNEIQESVFQCSVFLTSGGTKLPPEIPGR
jgi:hypothetical protein